ARQVDTDQNPCNEPATLSDQCLTITESGSPQHWGQRQILVQACVSTLRRICSISSKCSWVQVSGGASWITGSPRSSARQISPASNRACDRKPRSSRSDSSSVNVSLVVFSLTISIP